MEVDVELVLEWSNVCHPALSNTLDKPSSET